jgi:Tfp pilus assembly protein PilV
LIEMLVATTVFSFGMGGMAALMLSAAGGMAEAEHESQSHLHAAAMAASLQLSPAALEHLAIPPPSVPLCF